MFRRGGVSEMVEIEDCVIYVLNEGRQMGWLWLVCFGSNEKGKADYEKK